MTQPIESPDGANDYPQRADDCMHAIEERLLWLIADASDAGWSVPEIFDAIERHVFEQRLVYLADLNPGEDLS